MNEKDKHFSKKFKVQSWKIVRFLFSFIFETTISLSSSKPSHMLSLFLFKFMATFSLIVVAYKYVNVHYTTDLVNPLEQNLLEFRYRSFRACPHYPSDTFYFYFFKVQIFSFIYTMPLK